MLYVTEEDSESNSLDGLEPEARVLPPGENGLELNSPEIHGNACRYINMVDLSRFAVKHYIFTCNATPLCICVQAIYALLSSILRQKV